MSALGDPQALGAVPSRRGQLRLATSMECWYRPAGESTFRKTELCDLSETGACLSAAEHAGSEFDLTLRLGAGCYVSLKAATVWQRGRRLGLRFSGQRPRAVRKWLSGQRSMQVEQLRLRGWAS